MYSKHSFFGPDYFIFRITKNERKTIYNKLTTITSKLKSKI